MPRSDHDHPAVITRLVLASGNAGKLREFRRLLEPLGLVVMPQAELGVTEADEPHVTFIENALAKARHASARTGLPALADDSGICVDALGGAPGVGSARYAGDPRSDSRNNAALVAALGGIGDRRAHITHFDHLTITDGYSIEVGRSITEHVGQCFKVVQGTSNCIQLEDKFYVDTIGVMRLRNPGASIEASAPGVTAIISKTSITLQAGKHSRIEMTADKITIEAPAIDIKATSGETTIDAATEVKIKC